MFLRLKKNSDLRMVRTRELPYDTVLCSECIAKAAERDQDDDND